MASMKTIQIRNVPDEVHAELRVRAARAGMSLSDYALAELERKAAKPPIAEVLERARNRSGGLTRREIVDTIRAMRDDRD
jgi:plasmid stability protein